MAYKKYTKEFIEPIVKESRSLLEVLNKLNLTPSGGNTTHLAKAIKREEVDTSHFLGRAWSKGKTFPEKYPIEEYLTNKRFINSNKLKHRLIKEKYFEHKCYHCNLTTWMNYPIAIELHHIDNNHCNNNLSNLIILCSNCHSLTHKLDRGCHKLDKNKNIKHNSHRLKKYRKCCICDNKISKSAKMCKSCAAIEKNKLLSKRPDKKQLDQDLIELKGNISAIGRKYSVSESAVRKWFKYYLNR